MMHSESRLTGGVKASDNLEFGESCSRLGEWVSPQPCVSPFMLPRGRAFQRVLTVEMAMPVHTLLKKFKPIMRHIPRHSVAIAVIMSCINFFTTNKAGPPIIFSEEGHSV